MVRGAGPTWPISLHAGDPRRKADRVSITAGCVRDFTYIDDIVDGVVTVLDKPATPDPAFDGLVLHPGRSRAPYRVFNIGNQDPVALGDFIATIEAALGRAAIRNYQPMQPGDVVATHADVCALTAWTGVRPHTPLAHGIAQFVAWYRGHYGENAVAAARS